MKAFRTDRPSPALVIAAIALVFAMAGTAIAGPDASRAITKSKVKNIAKKQADKRLKANVSGSHVNTADTATNATSLGGSPAADFAKKSEVAAFGNIITTPIDNFTSATFTSVVSKSFTAPSAGFLFMIGNVSSEDDISLGGEHSLGARLRVDAAPVTTVNQAYESSGGAADDDGGNTTGMSAVVPITAGDHTAHLDARERGTGSFIIGRDISVMFVPSGSGVTTPVPAAAGQAAANK